MARIKTSEQSRARSKAATIEELTRGVGTLRKFLSQVEDLGREGFPYLDAARARTELQLRECIRRAFGEKSPEFEEHRQHKLLMDSPEATQQSITLIKTLIATLEQKKHALQEESPAVATPTPTATVPPLARPQMTLVPASLPTAHKAVPQAAPPPSAPLATPTSSETPETRGAAGTLPESAPISPTPSMTTVPHTLPQPIEPLATRPGHHLPEPLLHTEAAPAKPMTPPQPLRHEPAPIVHPVPLATAPPQRQEPPPLPPLEPHLSPTTGTSIQWETAPQPLRSDSKPVDIVKALCHRFHSVARQLRLRGEYRATLSVEDEVDVQDLLHALLRLQFDDIGTDEWTPSYTGGALRTTFLLNDNRLAVLVKKTRTGLTAKDLTDQLRIDTERYRAKNRCTTLLCFIYDPEGRIGNPRGFETNLSTASDSLTIDVLIAPK